MKELNSKVIDIVKSASFNTVSNLCNNLIYLSILHFMALNKVDASRHQNGLSISLCMVEICFGPLIQAFSNGLKQLYSQFYAHIDQMKGNKNLLLYQSMIFCVCLGLIQLVILSCIYDSILIFMNYDEEVIEMTQIGIVYLFINRMLLVIFEFNRAQLIGLKVFGPFAVFQSISFAATTLLCMLYSFYHTIGIHEAGFFMILHEILKIFCLSLYNFLERNYKRESTQIRLLEGENDEFSNVVNKLNLKQIIQEKQKIIDLLSYIKPLLLTLYIEYVFFNTSVILAGRYSKDFIVAAVCFSITNNLILKGILGLAESATSFCGTSFAAQDYQSSKEYLKYTVTILLCYEALFIFGLVSFSDLWARCFTMEKEIIANIHYYKYLYLVTVPIDGTQILLASYLQVVEKKVFVTKVALFSYIAVGIPLMYILGDVLGLKLGGIWLAVGLANIINLVKYIKEILSINYKQQHQIAIKNQKFNMNSDQSTLEQNSNGIELTSICTKN